MKAIYRFSILTTLAAQLAACGAEQVATTSEARSLRVSWQQLAPVRPAPAGSSFGGAWSIDRATLPPGRGVMAPPRSPAGPLDPVKTASSWRSPATLDVFRCIDPAGTGAGSSSGGGWGGMGGVGGGWPRPGGGPGLCGRKPVANRTTITWRSAEIERARVVPSALVRFGPFTLKHAGIGNASGISDTYRISVWARSPAVYTAGPGGAAQYQGAQANLIKIGERVETLSGFAQREVYVEAKLPGVFTALQLRASVASKSSRFPTSCAALPPSSSAPEALDAGCLQAAVNPLAVLDMRWVPLTILYEPPGNCSWSNLTEQHTAGAAIAAIGSKSTSSHTISDRGFFWDNEHSDISTERSQQHGRRTEVRLTRSHDVGTRLGLPQNNPGNPQCNVPEADVPARGDGGPGRGDLFVLLNNASMLYWDTANMTGSTFSPLAAPGRAESLVLATAQQIRSGVGLPPGVSFSEEERDAILSLSPYSVAEDGSITGQLSAPRFVALGEVIQLGQGLALEHSQSRQLLVEGSQTLTQLTKQRTSSTSSDLAVDLSMKVLAYGGSAAASAGASKILTGLGGGFAELAGSTSGLAIPELFKDQSTTTVVTSYGKTSFIQQTSDSTATQRFFLQDTQEGLSVALYYDTLFGTYVFAPHAPGSGWVIDDALRELPVTAWTLQDRSGAGAPLEQQMPAEVQAELAALGAVSYTPASVQTFRAARGATRVTGLPLQTQRGSSRMLLPWVPQPAQVDAPAQSLYIARDAQGTAVSQLWVTERRPLR